MHAEMLSSLFSRLPGWREDATADYASHFVKGFVDAFSGVPIDEELGKGGGSLSAASRAGYVDGYNVGLNALREDDSEL